MNAERATRRFFATDPGSLAKKLIGQTLVRVLDDGTRLAGIIVETEAYLGQRDKAAHSYKLHRSARNEPMYAPPGTAYVYFTYGMHHCFNVVAGAIDEPVAVLIRALEPQEGESLIRLNRSRGDERRRENLRISDLCSGPGKLCQALHIDRSLNGVDLAMDPRLFILRTKTRRVADTKLTNTVRVGIDSAGDWKNRRLRWYLTASPHVSVRKGQNPRRQPV